MTSSMNLLGAMGRQHSDDVSVLINENASIREALAEAREKIKRLSKNLSVAHQDVAKSVKSVAKYDNLEFELAARTEERDTARASLKSVTKEKEAMSQAIAAMETKLQNMEKSFTAQVVARDGEIAALKKKMNLVLLAAKENDVAKEALVSELAVTKKKVVYMEGEAASAEQKQKELQKEVNFLSSEKTDLTQKMIALGSAINENKRQNATLSAEKQALLGQLDKAVTDIRKLNAKANSLQESVMDRNKALQSLRCMIQNVEAAKEKEASQLKLVRRDLAVVSNARDKAFADCTALKLSLDDANRTILRNEHESNHALATLELCRKDLEYQKATLEANLRMTMAKLEAANLEILGLERTVDQQKEQIAEEKAKLAALGDSQNVQLLNVGKIASCTDEYF